MAEPNSPVEGLRDDTYDLLKDAPCRVDRVHVNPPDLRTRPFMIEREFHKARLATTLEGVASCAEEALANLQELGALRSAELEIVPGDANKPGTCHIDVMAEDVPRVTYRAGSFVTKSDMSFEGNVKLRSLFGYCEHQSLEFSRSIFNISDIAYVFRQPRVYGLPVHLRALVHQRSESFQKHSSFSERLRGGQLEALSSDGHHRLGYELSWIQLTDAKRCASRAVRRQLGDHIKSACAYSYVRDGRDSSVNPTRGQALRLAVEVGGLMPDTHVLRYVRQTLDMQTVSLLSSNVAISLDANLGLMLPILNSWRENQPTLIRERFFCGGVGSLRGFSTHGVGPKDARQQHIPSAKVAGNGDESASTSASLDALGGDVFASLRAAIHFELPGDVLRKAGVRGHVFVDTASTAQLTGTGTSVQQQVDEFWGKWRMSVGTGIQIPFGASGHFEINFVQVLKQHSGDVTYPGLQVGFSASPYMQVRPSAM